MRVIYNGIDLFVLETHAYDTEAVYDDSGTDYLYTRVSLAVRAVINGQAEVSPRIPGPFMSYTWGRKVADLSTDNPNRGARTPPVSTPGVAFPGAAPDAAKTTPPGAGFAQKAKSPLRDVFFRPNMPPLTHQVVRHRLGTPRGKLFVFSGPGIEKSVNPIDANAVFADKAFVPPDRADPLQVLVSVESPEGDSVCDCKNGPLPRIMGVYAVEGDANLFMVDWAVETYINEGPLNNVNPTGALLSNRFSQTQTVDASGYTTVLTQGTAVFRTDALYFQESNPDSNRPLLFMPILQGFVRENIVVTGRPDVTGVDYQYQDRQVEVNFVAAPYARAATISAVHRQNVSTRGDLYGGLLKVYGDYKQLRANKRFADGTADAGENSIVKAIKGLRKEIRRTRSPRRPAPKSPGTP